VRGEHVRALGFEVTGATQVSCNLVEPTIVTPKDVFEAVDRQLDGEGRIVRCELVGLVGGAVLDAVPRDWWEQLDLSIERTVEAAALRLGLAPQSTIR
jgi:hypothetical protein